MVIGYRLLVIEVYGLEFRVYGLEFRVYGLR